MSDYIDNEELENKLSLVLRKPQSGKSYICITSIIQDKSKNIHIVLTMNTLCSGMQFLNRMQEHINPKQIIVFNSDENTAGNCLYAKDLEQVLQYIRLGNIKVIVCCAHYSKIRKSIPQLLNCLSDSITITSNNIKFIIHIDEAHEYIPKYKKYIHIFNSSPFVLNIIGYTATGNNIWTTNDPLFHKILIRDVEKEYGIMCSEHYFGVKDCEHVCFEELNRNSITENIPREIPSNILSLAGKKERAVPYEWYDDTWVFDFGNELLMLGFLNYVLPTLQLNPNCFSYHFTPSYSRKVTHYYSVEIILQNYPTSNVIVLNGNGFELFRVCNGINKKILTGETVKERIKKLSDKNLMKKKLDLLLEPSYMIQQLICDTPNYPTFVTGFTCVGMSVTLINEEIGNFDNIIMCHEHYSREIGYQLCRFLFNYSKWSQNNIIKIKKTKFISLSYSVINTCLEYEADVERITKEFSGKSISLREINGLEPEELTEREMEKELFNEIEIKSGKICKKFKVYDGNDIEEWKKANNFYESILGKKIIGVSMPKINDEGFYLCSDSTGLGVHTINTFNILEKEKWSNRFKLKKDCLSYARVFVGYDNLEDPTEYTIFIKFVELIDKPTTRKFLSKYYGGESKSDNGSESKSDNGSESKIDNGSESKSDNGSEIQINQSKKNILNVTIIKKNRDTKKIFTNGQYIRHTIGIDKTWIGIYDSINNSIICNGIKYTGRSPLNKFASSHYKTERPDRTSRCNAWQECECEINEEWISTYKL